MEIKEISVVEHSEDEIIAEINKIIPILIERYNDRIGDGWDEGRKTYENNVALSEDDGDDFNLSNQTVVYYSDEELDPDDASNEGVEDYWKCIWTFKNDEDGFAIEFTMLVEDNEDVEMFTEVIGDYEVAYWCVLGMYEANWIPADDF